MWLCHSIILGETYTQGLIHRMCRVALPSEGSNGSSINLFSRSESCLRPEGHHPGR